MRVRFGSFIWLLGSILAFGAPLAARSEAPISLIVVRHAEKGPGEDPGLTAAGRARASALAHSLSAARLTAIVVSEWRRTQETAAPLAQALGLAPRVIRGDLPAALRSFAPGTRALVVSHSHVVPQLVKELGCGEAAPIGDQEYDRMYVLTLEREGRCTALQLRYGAASELVE